MSKTIKLQCVTYKRADVNYEFQAYEALEGGADAIRLSDVGLSAAEQVKIGKTIKGVCREHKANFLIAGRPDVALAVDADGVHLDVDDIPLEVARQILGPRRIIGVSANSLGQALAAAENGANYIALGPMFSAHDPNAQLSGIDIIRMVKKRVKIPVFAAGGVTVDTLGEALKAGADGIVVARAVCGTADIKTAARQMKEKISAIEKEIGTFINDNAH